MATASTTPVAHLPLFDGFPYLVTRMAPAMYHITLLPRDPSELELSLLARAQWRANRLDVCLVIGPDRALYISADGLSIDLTRCHHGVESLSLADSSPR